MSDDLKQFYELLTAKERELIPHLAADTLGIILRTAINELDLYTFRLEAADENTFEQNEDYYLFQLGTFRVIKLALEARSSFEVPVVSFLRDPTKSASLCGIIRTIGAIQHGRRVAQSAQLGICQLKKLTGNEFVFTISEDIVDGTYYERQVFEHYTTKSSELFHQLLKAPQIAYLKSHVETNLPNLVRSFHKHYIQYDTDPIIDLYYFGLAMNFVQNCEGFDTYHYSTEFGGTCFQHFILAATFLKSLSLRHRDCAEVLVRKEPQVKIENILTISSDKAELVESTKEAINHFGKAYVGFREATLGDAERTIDALSIHRSNISTFDNPNTSLPMLVQCSDTGIIRMMSGANDNPIRFLLDSLRGSYKKDFDKNQKLRELSMQRGMKRVLSEFSSALEFRENVSIKDEGRILTDIDFVVIDPSGVIVLFQLKHQELSGPDLYLTHTRANRLKEQAGKWLSAVDLWLGRVRKNKIRSTLRLKTDFHIAKIYRFVLTKHSSFPIKEYAINSPDILFSNWVQFSNCIFKIEQSSEKGNFLAVIREIQSEMSLPDAVHLPEPNSEWIIHDLIFRVVQEPKF